jgi:GT2 family glycosyltransferase
MTKSPIVSIVILNWNGRKRLEKCLHSIDKVTFSSKEIVVVNNGSTDDSKEFLKKKYPQIRVVELKKNVGYAMGKNIGVTHAKGKYILALDNDTSVTPHFLEPLVAVVEKDKSIGIVQPQIRSMIDKNLLDSVGAFMTSTGILYHYGYMKPYTMKVYKNPMYAYSIKGACFIIAKKDYIKLGGLDKMFLSYVEETDLCHRMWLYGKKVLYEPKSVIYHWGGGDTKIMTTSEDNLFRSFRNRYYSYIKNFSAFSLVKLLPVHFLFCEIFVFSSLVSGNFKKAFAVQWGTVCWIGDLTVLLEKRKYIQEKLRKANDKEIDHYIRKNPRFIYYWYLVKDIKLYKDA